MILDPDLQLYSGRQYTGSPKKNIFGIFLDSSPDRRGRRLILRREAIRARSENRSVRKLMESDYLLELHDASRMGALRFKLDERGELWIAKFPSRSDNWNIGAWEMICHRLAQLSGVEVPECRLENFSSAGGTFLTKRIVFSIAVSNTDDHLRKHGFILTPEGWVLSPAYDINPNPQGTGLSLNISEEDNALDYDLALSAAPLFRLNSEQAACHLREIRKSVARWHVIAQKLNIPRREIDEMSAAFNL